MKSNILVSLFSLLLICSQAQPVKPIAIKGTWITNVASTAMHTPDKVKETVSLCKKNGLTDIFLVVWNNGLTLYPSEVAKKYSGILQDTLYHGFDPLKAFVEEGHRAGLRVHAWFEFGFSYSYKDSSLHGWLQRYPQWVGRNRQGGLLKKNNFFWWNALHPEVQQFMKELVLEVVRKYQVDGVQGDDRLPAMPAEGGYDAYTLALYAKEHHGKTPPADTHDARWIQWKADKLSAFGKELYQAVKQSRSSCLVTWAPSIYPWSMEQYLQDWPAWLKGGYADYIIPQLYRYDLAAYEKIVKELANTVPASDRYKIFPGILTSLGDGYRANRKLFQDMVALNRSYGFKGEVCFYYETIREAKQLLY